MAREAGTGAKLLKKISKKLRKLQIFAVLAAGVSLCGNVEIVGRVYAQGTRKNISADESWEPVAKLLRELGRRTPIRGYTICPPIGTTFHEKTEGTNYAFGWQGGLRNSGITPALFGAIAPLPANISPKDAVEKALKASLRTRQKRFEDFTPGTIEHGQIDGIDFQRVRWSGKDRSRSLKMHGLIYVGIDNKHILFLGFQDAASPNGIEAKPAATAGSKWPRVPQPDPAPGTEPDAAGQEAPPEAQHKAASALDPDYILRLADTSILTLRRAKR